MKLNNSRTIISLRIKLFAATVLFFAYLVLAYFARIIKFPFLGIDDSIWTLFLIVLYVFVLIYPIILNYQYISYSDEGDYIIFRYFTSGIFGRKKNSIEINKQMFAGYEMESRYFGFIQNITLFQKFREGIAKYPVIYISSLTRSEKNKIIHSLNSFSPRT